MKPEKQRILIGEACGWKPYTGDTRHLQKWIREQLIWAKDGVTTPEGFDTFTLSDLPDYLNDLNAIHSAEQSLWAKDWLLRDVFIDHLARILDPINGYRKQHGCDLLDATAAQRAEAFLRTIGKWENT